MNRLDLVRALSAAAGGGLAAAGLPLPAAAQPAPAPLTLGLTSKSANEWPEYVGQTLGFFEKNGVKLDIIYTGSAAAGAQQLTAGALDVSEVSSTQIVEAIEGGAPLKAIVEHSGKAPYLILGKKGGGTTIAALKGKTIIVGGPNDITRVFMDKILETAKLKPDDYTYTFAGATSERFAALASGTVDAAILFPPFSYRAANTGYPVLDDVSKYFPSFLFDTFCVRPEWGNAHRDAVVRYVKGYLQSLTWLYDPANKAQAIKILTDATNVAPEDAAETYNLFIAKLHIYTANGVISGSSFGPVLDALVKIGQLKAPAPSPSKYIDNSYVNEANAQLRAGR